MYHERKHELILISKETGISQRHGEFPLRETKMTITNPQDLGAVLEDIKGFLQAAGYSFIQEISHTNYTYTEEEKFDDGDYCCNQGCCSEEEKEEIVIEPKTLEEETADVSNH